MRFFLTIILCIAAGTQDASAQYHFVTTEMAGNYSGFSFGVLNRTGLRSGGSSIPDSIGASSSEAVLSTVVMVPLMGDITESSTFAVGIELPYVSTTVKERSRIESSDDGISDVDVVGRYGFTFYRKFEYWKEGWTLKGKADLIAKVRMPIAAHAADRTSSDHGRMGGGSTDFALGCSILTETENWFMVHGHAMAWFNSTMKGNKAGNSIDAELLFLLASLPLDAEPVGTFLPAVGFKGLHSARDRAAGFFVNSSGTDLLFLSVGIQSLWMYAPGLSTFFAVEALSHIPLLQRVNGVQMGYAPSFSVAMRIYIK